VDLVVDGNILGYYKFFNCNWLWSFDQNPPCSFSGSAVDPLLDLVNRLAPELFFFILAHPVYKM